ncbi:outer membrane protein assembly factor BamD [Litorivicinus lipolyticus]|uniref:Outer membrane protein assembly factor BamD n=1 Tax=Litorivicinus lipolyticus TaxID=418701 RepID=A0A5Q2QEY8_9GAMM|nr:outer membrane protein assembly factor BamD [Litorivicinus lipolyticus]QGG80892.1 outer membrane protein assembly factor BamD [Litorivicinus lipolyticus]
MPTKLLLIGLLITLTGCSTLKNANRQSEAELYQTAIGHVDAARWDQAIDALEEVDSRFPFGPYARNSQLWLIYSYLKQGNEPLSRAAADRFLRLNPEDQDADYALYLKGLASFQEGFTVVSRYLPGNNYNRDPSSLLQASTDFRRLIQDYPTSPYVTDSRLRLIYTRQRLAEREIEVATFYVDRGAWVAAANRASVVIDNFPSSSAVIDALLVKAIASKALGEDELEQRALATLALNYPQYVVTGPAGYALPAQLEPTAPSLTAKMSFGLFGDQGDLGEKLALFTEARRANTALLPQQTLIPNTNVNEPRSGRNAGTETFF